MFESVKCCVDTDTPDTGEGRPFAMHDDRVRYSCRFWSPQRWNCSFLTAA